MISREGRQFVSLLVCPRSREGLELVSSGNEEGLVCAATGVLYPVIDGIVIMEPVTDDVKALCRGFLKTDNTVISMLGSRFSMEKTCQALSLDAESTDNRWGQEEMSYWERVFKSRLDISALQQSNWNRTLPRKRLLDRLPSSLNGKIFLEIGCGGASSLYDVYGGNLSSYIGLDLSFNACKLAQKRFPRGLFIQGSAVNLPFQSCSMDVIVAYGVLHHLPEHEEHLRSMLPVLKKDGYFVGSDPVLKPKIPRPRLRRKPRTNSSVDVNSIVPESGGSPHNEWIDWTNLMRIIDGRAQLLDVLFEYGPLRAVFIDLFYDALRIRSKLLTRAIIGLDWVWLVSFGKLRPSLGPSGVVYILRREAA
jgi:SAM-dependent methyltransferase/uncharacterized protein YbaR (Trm112 family)